MVLAPTRLYAETFSSTTAQFRQRFGLKQTEAMSHDRGGFNRRGRVKGVKGPAAQFLPQHFLPMFGTS